MSGRRVFAILGGTGPFGRGLARALAAGGAEVVIGSRNAERAREVARQLRAVGGPQLDIRSGTNAQAAVSGNPVFLALPFAAQEGVLRAAAPVLDDRLVICCGVIWPPGSRPGTSASEEAARVLRDAGAARGRVAAAFQTIAAGLLAEELPPIPDRPDVLVFADRAGDRKEAAEAAAVTGLPAVEAGPLAGSRVAEAALGVLIGLNRRGAARHAGLRVTGRTS